MMQKAIMMIALLAVLTASAQLLPPTPREGSELLAWNCAESTTLPDGWTARSGQWALRPGMYATAEIRMAMRSSALMVPASSVVRVLDRQVVFVVEDNAARAAQVATGIRSGDQVEILDGLKAGDEYVVMGQNKLTDGVRVERVKDAAAGGQPEK